MHRDKTTRHTGTRRKPRTQFAVPGQRLQIQITDDGSRTLVDPTDGVAFHSAAGAATETRHVYLGHSGVQLRLKHRQPTAVLEIGLGTGMAMLMTVDAARGKKTSLEYTAIDNNIVAVDLLNQLELESQLNYKTLADDYLRWLSEQSDMAACEVLTWHPSVNTRVHIHRQSAIAWASGFDNAARFDAIYFDPFAPEINPELWHRDYLGLMHRMLKPGGYLTTYCVSRAARDSMATAGFRVKKVPGPPAGKREIMVATKDYAP